MSRRTVRENVFQLIYERITTGEKNALTFDLFKEKNIDEVVYLETVYNGVDEKFGFLNLIIARYAKGFKAERIFKVDMSLLLLSAYEILFIEDVPDRVAVNEVLDLVKIYSTEKSGSFINGVLASVIKEKDFILYAYEHPEVLEEAEEEVVEENPELQSADSEHQEMEKAAEEIPAVLNMGDGDSEE